MSIEKSTALVLKVLPYRESSYILHVFSDKHGLIQGIAKGIRRPQSSQQFIERGFLIECLLYIHQSRDLQTIVNIQVIDFFQEIRLSLIKSALRDAAFEMVCTCISEPEHHPEMFVLLKRFCTHLTQEKSESVHPFALWLFYYRFSHYMGFGIQLENCIGCQKKIKEDAAFIASHGGLSCIPCATRTQNLQLFPAPIQSYLISGSPKPSHFGFSIDVPTRRRISWLLDDYCRLHCNASRTSESLRFIDEMAGWE